MKKILNFSLAVVIVLTALQVQARNTDFSLNVNKEKGKMVSFTLKDSKKVDLSLYDANETLLHSEKLTSKGTINRTYDLKDLPDGTYFLEAETATKLARYKITLIGKIALMEKTASSEIFKPLLNKKEGFVVMSILNLEKVPVHVRIYDEDNQELYNVSMAADLLVSQKFDLNPNPAQKYTFVINYNGRQFEEIVDVK